MELKELKRQMVDAPFRYVQDALVQGTAGSVNGIRGPQGASTQKEMLIKSMTVKSVAATAYAGGAETTSSSFKVFFLAMVLYPEAQRRAQAEIDAVVGNDRLPTFEDRPSMPFLEATLRETLRWHPVAPLGATVLPNMWAMSHDDVKYPDPNDFKPERFLNSDGTLNDDDRQLCLRRFYMIEKPAGDFTEPEWIPGGTSHPAPFLCSITPRVPERLDVL
ncbi:cytochrome P450 [Melanogaster broomeanus]|nr:cytochrome P450 [Melanogaster broomeanus]